MIGILLNDNGYEQDIRELLMAFYPGETFVHEEQDDQEHVRFYAEGEVNQERQVFSLSLRFPGASRFYVPEDLEPEVRKEWDQPVKARRFPWIMRIGLKQKTGSSGDCMCF